MSKLVRDTLDAYDTWSATYDTIDNPLVVESGVMLEERSAWAKDARVFELGCGTGRNALWALEAGARSYTGVDGSSGMLARAGARVTDPRARFIEAQLTEPFPLEPATFDLALIVLVIEHLLSVDAVFAAAARALRPQGRLFIMEIHPALLARGISANFRDSDGREIRPTSFRHDEAELVAAARAAGFAEAIAESRAPSETALARSPKLARYVGGPALLTVTAIR